MKYFIDEGNSPDLSVVTDDLLDQTGAQSEDGRLKFSWQNITGLICLCTDQEYFGVLTHARKKEIHL